MMSAQKQLNGGSNCVAVRDDLELGCKHYKKACKVRAPCCPAASAMMKTRATKLCAST